MPPTTPSPTARNTRPTIIPFLLGLTAVLTLATSAASLHQSDPTLPPSPATTSATTLAAQLPLLQHLRQSPTGTPGLTTNAGFLSFTSPYATMPDSTKTRFAADLREYCAMNGAAYQRGTPITTIPYKKQAEYAEHWFSTFSPEYNSLGLFFRDQFIYEALADATTIYAECDRLYDPSSTSHLMWCTATEGTILQRKD